MNLDHRTLTHLEKVFDLQMWAFGCDARRHDGNLFAARGMRQTPPPLGSGASSTWRESHGAFDIELSSTGVTISAGHKQLTLQRGPLGPQLRGAPVDLLPALAAWVLTWEAWVDVQVGTAWRQTTLAQRRRPSPWNVAGLRAQWLALKLASNCGTHEARVAS